MWVDKIPNLKNCTTVSELSVNFKLNIYTLNIKLFKYKSLNERKLIFVVLNQVTIQKIHSLLYCFHCIFYWTTIDKILS